MAVDRGREGKWTENEDVVPENPPTKKRERLRPEVLTNHRRFLEKNRMR